MSRDSRSRAGAAGIDNESPKQFASNLDSNLDEIVKRLHNGTHGFSRLRPFFVEKPGSSRERVICVPTVRDRLVQRTIVQYLASSRKLPIYNASSFGFIPGQGTQKAIEKAVELRSVYEWCLKTDIESFFDQVPRTFLKERVATALPNHSLVPIIYNAIDCEIRGSRDVQARASAQGIKIGLGIRQGMPLSPLLANLVLSKFDRGIEARRIPMIRYADDLLLFFGSREEAKRGQQVVEEHLERAGLRLSQTKTTLHGPERSVAFLGMEIAYLEKHKKYVARVSRPQIQKIRNRLESEYTYSGMQRTSTNLSETIVRLSRSIAAYLGVYHRAYDYPLLISELDLSMRTVLSNLYSDVFGAHAIESLDEAARRFLGLGELTLPKPLDELEW